MIMVLMIIKNKETKKKQTKKKQENKFNTI